MVAIGQFTENLLNRQIREFVKPRVKAAGVLSNILYHGWEKTVSDRRFASMQAANTRLRKTDERLKWGGFNLGNFSREDITNYCERRANNTRELMPKFPYHLPAGEVAARLISTARFEQHKIFFELPDDDFAAMMQLLGLYERACDPKWWRRKLRQAQKRVVEEIARDYDLVHKKAGGYVSSISLYHQRKQNRLNREMLQNCEAINQHGEVYTLAELQDLSVSNPEIRRAELMSRIRGFELMAEQQKHVAVFWTLTCPSKFHSHYANGVRNDKYNGATVRDAQNYLVRLWAGFRSWMHRNGIHGFGFRVAEPHHDGCPHWHILFFGNKSDLEKATKELAARALEVDGSESGAIKNRFKTEWIRTGVTKDGRKLSAAGYIAKYISKSIDGFSLGETSSIDMDGQRFEMGQDAENGAERVVAWARTHGIRQFQQIGGACVSVWREIRKLHGTCPDDEAAEIVAAVEEKMSVDAAVAWAVFNFLNGAGRDQRLKLWRDDLKPEHHNITFIESHQKENCGPLEYPVEQVKVSSFEKYGAIFRNQYGEAVKKIKGLILDGSKTFVTRVNEWVINYKNEVRGALAQAAAPPNLDLCQ